MILNPQDNHLFDTTFFSDLLDGHYFGIKPIDFPALATGLSGYSLITLAEIYVKRLNAEDTKYRDRLLATFKCYPLTDDIARQAGAWRREFIQQYKSKQLSRRDDVPSLSDCLIAATAHAHRLTWFTRDERHGTRFRQAGVSVSTYALTA
ncbi:MAG: PIN domain-containing protein [Anaerolineaceae bacterium]|nr:PIN domain-containing protein [Anaerolineaceae bacterium]